MSKLDAAVGGGFMLASVHELLSPTEGAPTRSLALWIAARVADRQRCILYIDAAGTFYPPGVVRLGVPLERLLLIRARRNSDALWVTEEALRCRAVAAVILLVRSLDTYVSRRLQLAAEAGGGLGLIIRTDLRPGHTFAASRLRLDPMVGESDARRMLVSVLKLREGRPVEPFVLELPDAAGAVYPHTEPGDRAGQTRRAASVG